MTEKCVAWFKGHPRAEYESNLAYMNAFLEYVAAGQAGEVRPNATTQTYVLARYSPEIEALAEKTVRELQPFEEVCITRAGCTVTSHSGPHTLGMAFLRK